MKINVSLIILICCSCNLERNRNIIGRYNNEYENAAIHYVALKKDSTFFHYYKKNNDSPLVNTGKWRFDPDKNEIQFENWIQFGFKTGDSCSGCSWLLVERAAKKK
jgi:hypothetical protein